MNMLNTSWWQSAEEVNRVELMLVRAGALPESERAYYRGKPYKWQKEAELAERLEQAMIDAGVDPSRGWEMTGQEIMDQLVRYGGQNARPRSAATQ